VNPSEKDNNLPSLEFIHFGITGASKEGILWETKKKKKPPWRLVRKRTLQTKRPQLVGEVTDNFCWYKGIAS
jgi:hypothetical protein